MKYVLLYQAGDLTRAAENFEAHRARWQEFAPRGLLMIGTFGDPQTEGSMAIFDSREAAEEFARTDPFVEHGVVRGWHIREWNEALGGRDDTGDASLRTLRR